MNYYPYFYPYMVNPAPRLGLLSRLFGGRNISFSTILGNAQRALGVVNQAIPVVKQVTPMVKNAKTMFKVMNEFKKVDTPNTSNTSTTSSTSTEEIASISDNGPTFFA